MIYHEDLLALATTLESVVTTLDKAAAHCRRLAIQLDPTPREVQVVQLLPDGDGDIIMHFVIVQDGHPTGPEYRTTLDPRVSPKMIEELGDRARVTMKSLSGTTYMTVLDKMAVNGLNHRLRLKAGMTQRGPSAKIAGPAPGEGHAANDSGSSGNGRS